MQMLLLLMTLRPMVSTTSQVRVSAHVPPSGGLRQEELA